MPETIEPGDASPVANPKEAEWTGVEIDPEIAIIWAVKAGQLYAFLGAVLEATAGYRPDYEKTAPDPKVLASVAVYHQDSHHEEDPMGTDIQVISDRTEGAGGAGTAQALDVDESIVDQMTDLSRTVGAWVYIACFAGIALAWSTSLVAPWAGGVFGASVAFVAGIWVIAARG